ncbi:MAG TPA: type II/IV secretion system ATPase subunit [Dehalococcoidia bacterium]|nr:type II/IV secretion system ATPase subunit [Dehalococcoidia bacterium]
MTAEAPAKRKKKPKPDEARQAAQQQLRIAATGAPHLAHYLRQLAEDGLAEPDYYEEIDRKMSFADKKNLIYRVDADIYVHILSDDDDARDSYVAIDPAMLEDLTPFVKLVEAVLLDYVDLLEAAQDDEEKRQVLLRAVEENIQISEHPKPKTSSRGSKGFKRFGRKGSDDSTIYCTPEQAEALRYVIVRDKIGMGILEPLIRDAHIEDISCSGLGHLFIEHKIFKALKASIVFTEMEELDSFVVRLSEKIKKPVTFRNPISDAILPDGSRINIVYGGDVSTRGSNFTIRKFTAVPLSILDIIDSGGISFEMAAYLSLMVQEGMNFFVSGETASGKTTLLNALTCFYEPDAKIVSIEDTPELQVPHPNWIREVVRGSMSAEDSSVTMFTLLKAALRQRPNAIIVGEIRGEEGAIAFQAMQTGHAVAATFHASSVEKLIQRLTGNPINVPKTYVDNLNIVCIASAVRLPNGKLGRRILSINELIGYDSGADAFSFIETYRWNSYNDTFEATGTMNSYLLEQQIAPRKGLDPQNKRAIYDEVDRRAQLFERLLKAGRTNFFDLYKAFSQAQRQGLI